MFKKYLVACLTFFPLALTAEPWPTIETLAKQAIVMDYDTGMVLFEKEVDQLTAPSSMTKIMTTYLVFKKLKEGRIQLNTVLPVSQAAWKMDGSRMFVEPNTNVSIEDLLRGIIIQSGNDACVVVAEGLAGSVEAFAREMTAEAKRLGAQNTTFKNPHGYPDDTHLSTVRDLAILARHLIRDFPAEYYALHAEREFTYNKIRQPNRNPLLSKSVGCDGIKTGHTEAGGYGVVISALLEGQRLILVVNGLASERERAEETLKLLTWTQRTFGSYRLLRAGETQISLPVAMGAINQVHVTPAEDVVVALPRGVRPQVKVELERPRFVYAGIKKGDVLAKVIVTAPDRPERTYPLVATTDVPRGGFFRRLIDSLSLLVRGQV